MTRYNPRASNEPFEIPPRTTEIVCLIHSNYKSLMVQSKRLFNVSGSKSLGWGSEYHPSNSLVQQGDYSHHEYGGDFHRSQTFASEYPLQPETWTAVPSHMKPTSIQSEVPSINRAPEVEFLKIIHEDEAAYRDDEELCKILKRVPRDTLDYFGPEETYKVHYR